MDLEKLKYMRKLAMKYAEYTLKAAKFEEKHYEKQLKLDKKEPWREEKKYAMRAEKYRTKALYIKGVYDLEVKIQGAIHNSDTTWDVL